MNIDRRHMTSTVLATMVCLLLLLPVARAESFVDDFNREDTDFSSVANSMVGDAYTIHRGKFGVIDGQLATEPGAVADKVILLEHIRPSLDSGGKLRCSVDFMITEFGGNVALGLSWDYVEGEQRQFSTLRFRWEGESQSLQVFSSAPGEPPPMTSIPVNRRLEPGRWYSLALNAESYPNLEYTLTDKENGEIASGFVDLAAATIPCGGAVAIVIDGDGTPVRLDNFQVSTD